MKIPDFRTKLQKIGEKKLQGFGANIAKAVKSYKRPQSSLKARQNAWYEGGSGPFPKK